MKHLYLSAAVRASATYWALALGLGARSAAAQFNEPRWRSRQGRINKAE